MKFVFSCLILGFGLAAALPAQADYLCSYKESGLDLKYVTRIEFRGPDRADVQTAFVVNGQEHPGCAGVAPFTVTQVQSRYEFAGTFLCEDQSEQTTVLRLDPATLQLEIGHRVEDCVPQPTYFP